MLLRRIVARFSRRHYQPLVTVQISRARLLHNLHEYKKNFPTLQFAPVLKSNAYGHGLVEVASILAQENVPFLIVDSYYEAMVLRRAGITTPLLLIGYVPPSTIASNRLQLLSFTVVDKEQITELARMRPKKPINLHIKIDTGMHRQGIVIEELPRILELFKTQDHLKLQGFATHLADADGQSDTLTLRQLDRWQAALAEIDKHNLTPKYLHVAASAGVRYADKTRANMVRLGIGLYGIERIAGLNLKPVLSLQTKIVSIRTVQAGETVGYAGQHRTSAVRRIATIPVGYYEGIDRRLSDQGFVFVGTSPCAIVGRVSMNLTSIDVTDAPNASIGDQVTVISHDAAAPSSIQALAAACQTIPYDMLVHIPSALKRIIVN